LRGWWFSQIGNKYEYCTINYSQVGNFQIECTSKTARLKLTDDHETGRLWRKERRYTIRLHHGKTENVTPELSSFGGDHSPYASPFVVLVKSVFWRSQAHDQHRSRPTAPECLLVPATQSNSVSEFSLALGWDNTWGTWYRSTMVHL